MVCLDIEIDKCKVYLIVGHVYLIDDDGDMIYIKLWEIITLLNFIFYLLFTCQF